MRKPIHNKLSNPSLLIHKPEDKHRKLSEQPRVCLVGFYNLNLHDSCPNKPSKILSRELI